MYERKRQLYSEFIGLLKKKWEYLDDNENIIERNNETKKSLKRLRRPQIKKRKRSIGEDLKMISFMVFFIISGLLLFISYNNNEKHRQDN